MSGLERNHGILEPDENDELLLNEGIKNVTGSNFFAPLCEGLKYIFYFFKLFPPYLFSMINNIWKSPKSFKGNICLVTGAGRGLGRELSLQLAKLGAKVVCVDIKEELNNETVKMIKKAGGKAHGYQCNVANYDDVMNLAEKVQQEVGRVYMLINNAGLIMSHKAGEWPPEDVLTMFNVNVISQYWTIQAFLPAMKENNEGHIVAISSMVAFTGLPGFSVYNATKSAVLNLVKTLQMELNYNENNKIIVSGVYPTVMNTSNDLNVIFRNGQFFVFKVKEAASTILNGLTYDELLITVPRPMKYFTSFICHMNPLFLVKLFKELKLNLYVPTNQCKNKMLFTDIKQKCLNKK